MLEFTVQGVNRVRNGLRRLAATMPGTVSQVLHKWSQQTRAKLKGTPYPPAPAGSRYARTGRLANSWSARVTGTTAVIRNTASYRGKLYAGYVVGDSEGRQAWMHRGRWWKAREVMEGEVPSLRAQLERALQRQADAL